MSDYTIKNLKQDVENSAEKFGLAPDIEAHFARDPLECHEFGLSYQRLSPNTRFPYGHHQNEQEEVYVVVEGSGRVKLDDEIRDLEQWDAVRVDKDTIRSFEAGQEGMAFLAFGAPKTESQDAEMIPNWWSD
ncbi:MAG TPA: cupin domain-containing protein [Gaiellaceae bacterium]|jgi:mannose-6-phosphate isomerase-like protein (cupin superfamily)